MANVFLWVQLLKWIFVCLFFYIIVNLIQNIHIFLQFCHDISINQENNSQEMTIIDSSIQR